MVTLSSVSEPGTDSKKEHQATTTTGRFTLTRVREDELHPATLPPATTRVVLHSTPEKTVTLIPVSRQAAIKQPHHSEPHKSYSWTVIIHTGSDPAVLASLHSLAAKNAGTSILIQRDPRDARSFKVQSGHDNLAQIAAHHRVRYILAGHGDAIANTLDGRSPQQTYTLYQQIRQQFQLPPAVRLVLLACALGNDGSRPEFKENFALNFAHLATKETPISPSVRAYSRAIFINEAGKRLPADMTDPDSDILPDHRVEYRNNNQLMEVNGIPEPLIDILQEATKTGTEPFRAASALTKTHQHILQQYFPSDDGGIDQATLATAMQSLPDLRRVVLQRNASLLLRALTQEQWSALSQLSTQLWNGHIHPQKLHTTQQGLLRTAMKKITHDSNKTAPVMPVSHNTFTGGFFTALSRTLQILGILSAIKEILTRPFSQGLAPEQEALLETQYNLLIATLVANVGNETTQHLLTFTGRHIQVLNLKMPSLIRQVTPLSEKAGRFLAAFSLMYADSLTDANLKGLRALARGMNGLFPALGAMLGIQEVLYTAMALTEETDPQKRTDLHTRFALSLAGTATLFTGPAALPLSMLLLLAGVGYSAFRHYEYIGNYLTLSPAAALLVFFSPPGILPVALKIPFEANRTRAELSRLQQEQAYRVLKEKTLDAVYFSPRKVKPGRKLSREENHAIYHTVQDSWFARLILAAARIFSTPTTSPAIRDSRDDIDLNSGQFISDDIRFLPEKMRLLRTGRRKLTNSLQVSQPDPLLLLLDARGNKTEQLASFDGIFIRLLDDEGKVKQRIAAPTGKLPRWVLSGNVSGDTREEILLLDPQKKVMTVLTFFTGRESSSPWGFGVHSEGGDYLRRPKVPRVFSRQKNYYWPATGSTDVLTADPLLADIDGDGFDDLLLMSVEGISICYGGWETPVETQWSFFSFYPTALAGKAQRHVLSGRQNRDHRADLVVITDNGAIHTLLGSSDRRKKFTVLSGMPDILNAERMQQKNVATLLHDLDEDGRADIVIIQDDYQGTRAMVAHGQAEGKFGRFLPDAFSVWRDSGCLGLAGHRLVGFKKNSTTLVSIDNNNAVYEHIFTRYLVAEVMLDSGDDRFRALSKTSHWRYIIRAGKTGKQRHEAGTNDDIFWLQGTVRSNNGSLLDGREGQDTLIIAEGSRNERPVIFLGTHGNAGEITATEVREHAYSAPEGNRHRRFSKSSLSLLNIEHIQGHKDSSDEITGNEDNNGLSGVHSTHYDHTLIMQPENGRIQCECQEDYLDGGGGHNELTLSRGTAVNGSVYQIVQCEHDTDTEVVLKTGGPGEISQVFLGYHAEQMQRPLRAGNDLLIRLQHNKGTHKLLRLSSLYEKTAHLQGTEDAVTAQGGFVLHTSDGISLSFLRPSDSEVLPDGHPVHVTWDARYHRNWSELTEDQPAQHIEVLQQKKDPGDSRGKIKIYGHGFTRSTVTLADFMQLTLTDTPYSNRQQGDDKADRLCAFWMKGGNSEDSYHWDGGSQETIIDNNATDGIADLLVLPWQAEKSQLKRQGNNLILSEQVTDGRRFLILNFFAAADYRHLNVRDASNKLCVLDVHDQQASLASWQLQPIADARAANRRVLYATTGPLTLDMRTATGWVLTEDHSPYAHRWYGSDHDDVHIFRKQNKTLYDAGGNDIYLFEAGSQGNVISDSAGDDIYRIDAGSGHNIIADGSGQDTLELAGVNETQLQQKRNGDDHVITWSATGSLKIQNYYLNDTHKLENILLTEAISGMSVPDMPISTQAGLAPLFITQSDIATLSAAIQPFRRQ